MSACVSDAMLPIVGKLVMRAWSKRVLYLVAFGARCGFGVRRPIVARRRIAAHQGR